MTGMITGQVVDATGAPVAGATVVVNSTTVPISEIASLTDGNGQFRRSGLEAGSYSLAVRKDGQVGGAVDVDVVEGQLVNLEIRLGEAEIGNESSSVLEVNLATDHIDWGRVQLVRVALDHLGSGRGDAVGKDFLLTPRSHDVPSWQVQLSDENLDKYSYKIEYFMADGSRRSVQSTDASERTLILDPTS